MAGLKARFMDVEKGLINYQGIHGSDEFESYKNLSRGLKSFDLHSLQERNQKLAFWINIYNTAVIHGVIELGIQKSVRETFGFFDRVVYEIGDFRFSLNEIEHGILRGNRRPPYGLRKPFRKKDPRMLFAISPPDLRIHFALVCGARSCPPIGFYEADQIDLQLQLASESFINSPQVKIYPKEETVCLSKIFKWYKGDFGGRDSDLVDLLLRYLDEGENKTFLQKNRENIRLRYLPYDWNLNQEP